MAAKEESVSASQEGNQRIVDLALQAVYKGTGATVRSWNEKSGKDGRDGGEEERRTHGRKAVAQKEAKGK